MRRASGKIGSSFSTREGSPGLEAARARVLPNEDGTDPFGSSDTEGGAQEDSERAGRSTGRQRGRRRSGGTLERAHRKRGRKR